ncbi:unnamed protein product [Trichogramma brassicae]|uniref:Uncharacterized protein n=1 Tax=Trichogramma brassicae TaxID=86971 RepID=A0A6H5I422_9HYME|nr:unnamed protein product [Trichogramma brassicae]
MNYHRQPSQASDSRVHAWHASQQQQQQQHLENTNNNVMYAWVESRIGSDVVDVHTCDSLTSFGFNTTPMYSLLLYGFFILCASSRLSTDIPPLSARPWTYRISYILLYAYVKSRAFIALKFREKKESRLYTPKTIQTFDR